MHLNALRIIDMYMSVLYTRNSHMYVYRWGNRRADQATNKQVYHSNWTIQQKDAVARRAQKAINSGTCKVNPVQRINAIYCCIMTNPCALG